MSPLFFSGDFQALNDQLKQFLQACGGSRLFVITDSNIHHKGLHIPASHISHTIVIEAGEENKNIRQCQIVWDALLQHGADRKSLVLNLGGGVVTDLGGFAASCFKRGIRFINIPTTLMGMVDAAIGGKTGVNFSHYKNQIGTFSQPEAVFICPAYLGTLETRELYSGFAEICKYGLIGDTLLWDSLKNMDLATNHDRLPLIRSCAEAKKRIVENDPQENGLRKVLNFGHTIGHAIESLSLDTGAPLTHGHSIALGMVAESRLSVQKCGLPESAFKEIKKYLMKHYPVPDKSKYTVSQLIGYMMQDKKNRGGHINFALLENIGACVYDINCSEREISEALDQLFAE